MKKPIKPAKRPARRQLITPGEALRRAAQHVAGQMFKGARVIDGAESNHRAYGVRRAETWLVYKNLPVTDIRSSEIVVVCKRTGRVLYDGSAGDEG